MWLCPHGEDAPDCRAQVQDPIVPGCCQAVDIEHPAYPEGDVVHGTADQDPRSELPCTIPPVTKFDQEGEIMLLSAGIATAKAVCGLTGVRTVCYLARQWTPAG